MDSTNLLSQLPLGISCLSLLSTDEYYNWAVMLTWHLCGCWDLNLKLIQQALYPWSYLPSPTFCFVTGSPYVNQAHLELNILLPFLQEY